jgi:hypothetical protein
VEQSGEIAIKDNTVVDQMGNGTLLAWPCRTETRSAGSPLFLLFLLFFFFFLAFVCASRRSKLLKPQLPPAAAQGSCQQKQASHGVFFDSFIFCGCLVLLFGDVVLFLILFSQVVFSCVSQQHSQN